MRDVNSLPAASLWMCDTHMREMEWSLPAVKFYFLNELESHGEVVSSLFDLSSGWLYFMLKGQNLLFKALGRSFTPRWISISSDASGAVLSLAEGSHCFQQDYACGSVCFANTDECYLIPVWQRSVCLPSAGLMTEKLSQESGWLSAVGKQTLWPGAAQTQCLQTRAWKEHFRLLAPQVLP